MRAIGYSRYGGPEVLQVYDLPEIHAGPGQIRIRNRAATVNPADVLTDFKEDAVKAAAQKLVAAGHSALAVRCDVSDDAEVAAMVDRTVAELGRLDAAFNNAGVMARIAPIADSSRQEWDRVIGINLRGVWNCMKQELRHTERQGSGAIVNNASVGALTGNPGIASYIASRHAVVGLTRTGPWSRRRACHRRICSRACSLPRTCWARAGSPPTRRT